MNPWHEIKKDIKTPGDVAALLRMAAEYLPDVVVKDEDADEAEDYARHLEDMADSIEDGFFLEIV